MNNVYVTLEELESTILQIGYVAENERTKVCIYCKSLFDEYPDALPSMTVSSPAGVMYPAIIVRAEDFIWWMVEDSDLVKEGNGELQLTFTVNNVVAKSCIGTFHASRSLVPNGVAPDPIADWIVRADEILASIPQQILVALNAAMDEITGEGETLPPGSSVTVVYDNTTKKLIIGVPKGDKGDPGDPTELIDDTAGAGTTNRTWSANKLVSDIGKKYTKPADGIPASDIAPGVIPDISRKQDKINANGLLKGTGSGNVVAAEEGVDYINGDIIAVQDETPTDPNTQVWFPETQSDPVQVPTYSEYSALEARVRALEERLG